MRILARANVYRCVGCIILPIIGIFLYCYFLFQKGYDISDFILRATSDFKAILANSIMAAGLMVWFAVIYPKAIIAFLHRDKLFFIKDMELYSYGNFRINLNEVNNWQIKRGFLQVDLIALISGGESINCGSCVLTNLEAAAIMDEIKNYRSSSSELPNYADS